MVKVPYQLVSHCNLNYNIIILFTNLVFFCLFVFLFKKTYITCNTGSEPEIRMSSMKTRLAKSSTGATFSTPKPTQSATVPSTAELYRTLRLIPDSRYYSVKKYNLEFSVKYGLS